MWSNFLTCSSLKVTMIFLILWFNGVETPRLLELWGNINNECWLCIETSSFYIELKYSILSFITRNHLGLISTFTDCSTVLLSFNSWVSLAIWIHAFKMKEKLGETLILNDSVGPKDVLVLGPSLNKIQRSWLGKSHVFTDSETDLQLGSWVGCVSTYIITGR